MLNKVFTLKTPLNVLFKQTRFTANQKLKTLHKVNDLERKFLVWTGKFKTAAEVPNFVGQDVMERARNRMRIKIANYMMLATVVGCAIMIYLGKQGAKRGDNIAKSNLEWHASMKSEGK